MLEGVQFPCTYSAYETTTNGALAKHWKEAHESAEHCSYKATESLKERKKYVHEGVKYQCKHCSYEATIIGHLKEHKRKVHEGV